MGKAQSSFLRVEPCAALIWLSALDSCTCHHLTQPASLASPYRWCMGSIAFYGNAVGTAVEGHRSTIGVINLYVLVQVTGGVADGGQIPTICGQNSGQHIIYSAIPSFPARLSFVVGTQVLYPLKGAVI